MSARKATTTTTTGTEIAKSANAITIASELRGIVESIVEAGGECSDETLARLKSWEAALEIKAENICLVKSRLEADMALFKSYEDAAKARRKTLERAWENLRRYLTQVMRESGAKQIKKDDGLFTVGLQEGRVSVQIDNPDKLPEDLVEVVVVYKPRTDAIKEALEAGRDLAGAAHLETGESFVAIRLAGSAKGG